MVLLAEGGEHDDRRAVGALAEMVDDGVAGGVGEADIEDDGVEDGFVEQAAGVGRGGRGDDGMAAFEQTDPQEFDHAGIVFYDEDVEVG